MMNKPEAHLSAGTPAAEPAALPPAWVVGGAVLPFGLVVGFTITALPFLLTRAGVTLDTVAGVSAAVMSPTFWGFLLQPLMDTGLTRRAYCWLTAGVAAVCIAAALAVLSPHHLGPSTALLLLAELAIVLYSGALTGWTAEITPDARRGAVSGWTNVANLGAGALGAMAVMSLSQKVALHTLGLGLGATIVLGVAPTIWFPSPSRSQFHFRQIFTAALKTVWQAARTPECLTGFALFLAPVSAVAAINLFSGLGDSFHAPAATVIWVTGAGVAIFSSVGALLGGYAADRVPRGRLYLGAGMAAGITALAMAYAPRDAATFVVGVLVYNGVAGVAYAAFNALGYEIVGRRNAVASTQLGLFSAATNGAIVYMTWADGQGFKHFGARGLLLTDALAALIAGALLLILLGRRLRRVPGAEPPLAASSAQ